jgi:hypothetical protein
METLLLSPPVTEDSGLSSFLDSTKLEFQAALQLLVERAAFVAAATGAAIALKENESFIYYAVAGDSAAQPGSEAGANEPSVRNSIEQRIPVRTVEKGKASAFGLKVPILGGEEAIGILELTGPFEYRYQDIASVSRISNLVSVAVEYRDAAEKAAARIAERGREIQARAQAPSWHAPDSIATHAIPDDQGKAVASPSALNAQGCASCGFPVSSGRRLCVECERQPDVRLRSPNEVFTIQTEENWLAAHGYTILSVLIPAIAAAVYFWLRR